MCGNLMLIPGGIFGCPLSVPGASGMLNELPYGLDYLKEMRC